jgi:hypothetical protein
MYIWFDDGTSQQWVPATNAPVATPPAVLSGTPVLLAQQTVSNVATVDFLTLDATYDEYEVRYWNWQPVTSGAQHLLRISTDGGATWKAGASDYQWGWVFINATSSGSAFAGGPGAAQILLDNTQGTVAGWQESGVVKFVTPPSLSLIHHCIFDVAGFHPTSGLYRTTGFGTVATVGTFNAIRFYPNTGNISTGTYKLFGIKK